MGKEPDAQAGCTTGNLCPDGRAPLAGKTVVRLRCGDPLLHFGSARSARCWLRRHNDQSSPVLPALLRRLPMPATTTYRKMAQSFTVITGHTCGDQPLQHRLGRPRRSGMLVILMGIKTWPISPSGWCRYGAGSTPAAVIQWGTTDAQGGSYWHAGRYPEKTVGIRPPAVIVVGEVVDLHQQTAGLHRGIFHSNFDRRFPKSCWSSSQAIASLGNLEHEATVSERECLFRPNHSGPRADAKLVPGKPGAALPAV